MRTKLFRATIALLCACGPGLCQETAPPASPTPDAAPTQPAEAESAAEDEEVGEGIGVGSPAPPLQVAKFVQGDPVKEFERDKVYLVEFWATWCGPCVESIPHVNALHEKFKDKGLVVIGQNVWEKTEAGIPEFLRYMAGKMNYRVALDDKTKEVDGAMAKSWMEAAGQGGIPCAFVIGKDGKIAWIGHPGRLSEEMVAAMLDGTFDAAKVAAEAAAASKTNERLTKRREMVKKTAVVAKAIQNGDWDSARTVLAEIEPALPSSSDHWVKMSKLRILLGTGASAEAAKLAAALTEAAPKDVRLHIDVAWELVRGKERPDNALAEKLARGAIDSVDPAGKALAKETLSRVIFIRGEVQDAIKLIEEALAEAPDALKPRLQATLAEYQQGRLPKE